MERSDGLVNSALDRGPRFLVQFPALYLATPSLTSFQMSMVKSMEEQLQIRTSKLATLEKVLTNTRRHLQDAVENVRETELQYQAKIEEMEQEYEEERIDHEEKMREVSTRRSKSCALSNFETVCVCVCVCAILAYLLLNDYKHCLAKPSFPLFLQQMQNRLELIVMQSKNCVNTGLTNIDINPSDLVKPQKDKTEAMQRLEELVKEQKGKLEQLTEDHSAVQTEIQTLKVSYGTLLHVVRALTVSKQRSVMA